VKFNINDTVRVRLTDYGRAVLRDDWQSTTNIYYARPEQRAIRGEYKPPKEDEHGWSEWQLWALMEAFGEHTGHGCRLCFETEIEIVGAEVAKAEAELAALKADRDAARRDLCGLSGGFDVEQSRRVAKVRGWDCFDAEGDKTC
jgi:hypothetical protein